MNLFNEPEKEIIRTIGFYQPYCSLMLHGKVETRWVRAGKKPPFPLGKYVGYSTKQPATEEQIISWCNEYLRLADHMINVLALDATKTLNGYAIWHGQLVKLERANDTTDPNKTFVAGPHTEIRIVKDKEGKEKEVEYHRWLLFFDDVKSIRPFEFKYGKQGVGIYPDSELDKIEVINPIMFLDAKKLQIPDSYPQLIKKNIK